MAKIFNGSRSFKEGIFYTLIICFFCALAGQEPSRAVHTPFNEYAVDSHSTSSAKAFAFDAPSPYQLFAEVEIEEEEEQEDHHYYANGGLFQLLCLPLVIDETIKTSLFPPKKPIKLFILFHSWKSFLPI